MHRLGVTTGPDTTQLLLGARGGDRAAFDRLFAHVYGELRDIAHRRLVGFRLGETLGTTALVHEAYLRLVDQRRVEWRNRAQFFGVAAEVMRRILVDHARARHAAKRGGDAKRVTLGDADAADESSGRGLDILALHDALERLAALDPQQSRVVELRYFGGLNIEETAEAMGISPATVKREWAVARGWLRRELEGA